MIKKLLCFGFACAFGNIFSQTLQSDSTSAVILQPDTSKNSFIIPIFSTSGGDADNDLEQQDASSLLSSSRDVFTQFASFQFGPGRFRMRGYSGENQMIMVNGLNMNSLETGFSSWSSWGGLNDVTRFVEVRFGTVNNRLGFSGPGGYTNIDSKASSFRKGTRISYANANRMYRNRVMLTHSTGLMENGWALTLSASSRWGNEVYIPGTYYRANAFYASIDKKINEKHLLSFTGFGAPIEQGRAGGATKEMYDLAGTNYYNSLWGYQNGEVRNSNVNKTNRPMLMLSHIFKINSDSRLTTSAFYNFGKSKLSGLNWNDAPNPKPDYYRYLPSYYYLQGDTANGDVLKSNWENNTNSAQQINWDRLIGMNQANLYTLPSQLGQGINTSETRARYIIEDKIENIDNKGFNSVYNTRIENFFLSIGFNANIYKNRKYKEINDLLGATFWIDVDQFAENLGVEETFQQNDIENPNKKIYKGDKFGYDYSLNINKAELWSQGEYSFKSVDVYVAGTISDTKYWREGYVANGKFPTTSKGNSEKVNFLNYGIKIGATYKITGRHFLTVNGSYLTRAPEINSIFLSPRVRNDYVRDITKEKVTSADINYLIKYPGFKLRFTGYYTKIEDQVWLRTFWHDFYNNNVNLIMKNIDQTHQGIEFGVEKTLFTAHTIQGALGVGQFVYQNRPTLEAWQDNNNLELYRDRLVYLTNYRIGNGPQLVSGIGYKYSGKKRLYAGLFFNYFDQIYLEPNPDRRTAESANKFQTNETEQAAELIKQEKLPSYFTLNANGGKSFRIANKYFLNINLSINNILNNQNIITSGYEQLRWDGTIINKFPNKYYFMTGATYMIIVNFSF
ncbi:MAG: hypothetical protein Q7W45_06865 [Bacteroidota bacterium]|nr:hypothetical protein [Bacteroidota bacterium]MDP3146550.1 hypothetical protein [Bacteroidota bacterium]